MTTETFAKNFSGSGGITVKENGTVIGGGSNSYKKSWFDSRVGTSNPAWRAQVRAGIGATTPFIGTKFQYNSGYSTGSWRFKAPWNPSNKVEATMYGDFVLGNQPNVTPAADINTSGADSDARVAFLGKCREVQRQFQGGVFLGELRETLQMIRNPAKALRRGVDDYYRSAKKRSRGLPPKRANRVVQDTWLEYVFGWKPLINDISDANNALSDKPSRTFVPVMSTRSRTNSSVTVGGGSFSIYEWKYILDTQTVASSRYKGACVSSASNPVKKGLSKWGISPDNFVPTVWELIPYSFLVDYFTNIGQVLDGWSLHDAGIAWCNHTFKVERRQTLQSVWPVDSTTRDAVGAANYQGASLAHQGYLNASSRVDRAAYDGVAVSLADIHFRVPGSDSLKWLNIAALAKLRR